MQFFSEHYLLGTAQTLTSESAHPPRAESPRKRRQRAGTSLSGIPADRVPGPSPSILPSLPRGKLSLPRTNVPHQHPDLPPGAHTPAAAHAQGRAS